MLPPDRSCRVTIELGPPSESTAVTTVTSSTVDTLSVSSSFVTIKHPDAAFDAAKSRFRAALDDAPAGSAQAKRLKEQIESMERFDKLAASLSVVDSSSSPVKRWTIDDFPVGTVFDDSLDGSSDSCSDSVSKPELVAAASSPQSVYTGSA